MSELTLSISVQHETETKDESVSILADVQKDVEEYFSNYVDAKYLNQGKMIFSWYDDAPVSSGVALTTELNDLEGFDLIAELQLFLRKKGYLVSAII